MICFAQSQDMALHKVREGLKLKEGLTIFVKCTNKGKNKVVGLQHYNKTYVR